MNRFDYLTPATGAVIEGLDDHEKIYALEQMGDYLPIRTLSGDAGRSAIYRLELSDDQRQIIGEGGDILVEILHYGGPLAPSRVMVLNQRNLTEEETRNFARWLTAQLKLKRRETAK